MSTKFQYRPDIDGLRAVAVLLVVAFHAKVGAVSGGFIGVDVFFVISGFLITAIIAKEVEDDCFSYKRFYLRRIKRIAPALVALLVLTTIPAYLFLFSDDFEMFARNLIHAFIATSNFFLWENSSGYFSPNTDLFPLLHTWSLAVEEQFYFIWPLLYVLMQKLTKGRYLIAFSFVFLATLIGLSIHLANTAPNSAYYLLPARAFELMMGAQLAIVYSAIPKFDKTVNNTLSVVGILLIFIPSFLISKESVFPGLNALWPCIGAVMLIISGRNAETSGILNTVLSHRYLVATGLISYSLYLWHWPIFVFVQYQGLEFSGLVRVASIILAFLFGYLSWRYVEQPMRHAPLLTLRSGMLKILLPSFIVVATIYGIVDSQDGFPHRFHDLAEFNKKKNFPSTVRKHCFDAYHIGNTEQCGLGERKPTLDGMLIGDSFANHSASFIDVLAKDAGLFIHDSAAGGYPLLARLSTQGKYGRPPKYGEERLAYALKFQHLIIAANWESFPDPNHADYQNILSTLESIVKKDITVHVVINLPDTTKEHLHRQKLLKAGGPIFFDQQGSQFVKPKLAPNHIILEMKKRFPQISYIDLKDAMCNQTHCDTQIENTIIYRNFNHLNTSGAALLGKKYLTSSGNPFIR